MWDNDIHIIEYGRKYIVAILHIYGAETFFYYFVITKTPNLSKLKEKLVYISNIIPEKISKALLHNNIYTIKYGRKAL